MRLTVVEWQKHLDWKLIDSELYDKKDITKSLWSYVFFRFKS